MGFSLSDLNPFKKDSAANPTNWSVGGTSIGDIGRKIDQTVRNDIPGGWGTVGAGLGAYYAYPYLAGDAAAGAAATGGAAAGTAAAGGSSYLPWVIGGGSLLNAYSANQAANAAADASNYATNAITGETARQFDITRQDTAPYRQAGVNALNTLSQAPQYAQFDYNLQADPGYNFAVNEATRGVNRAAAGQGQFNSGNRLAALADRITGMASQYANDAFNRQQSSYLTNYGANQDYLNRQASIAGLGQTGVSQAVSAGNNMVSNNANALLNNANVQGNAAYNQWGGINNAIQGGIGNYIAYDQNNKMMNYLNGR